MYYDVDGTDDDAGNGDDANNDYGDVASIEISK